MHAGVHFAYIDSGLVIWRSQSKKEKIGNYIALHIVFACVCVCVKRVSFCQE